MEIPDFIKYLNKSEKQAFFAFVASIPIAYVIFDTFSIEFPLFDEITKLAYTTTTAMILVAASATAMLFAMARTHIYASLPVVLLTLPQLFIATFCVMDKQYAIDNKTWLFATSYVLLWLVSWNALLVVRKAYDAKETDEHSKPNTTENNQDKINHNEPNNS